MLAHGALLECGGETDRRYDRASLLAGIASIVDKPCREVVSRRDRNIVPVAVGMSMREAHIDSRGPSFDYGGLGRVGRSWNKK